MVEIGFGVGEQGNRAGDLVVDFSLTRERAHRVGSAARHVVRSKRLLDLGEQRRIPRRPHCWVRRPAAPRLVRFSMYTWDRAGRGRYHLDVDDSRDRRRARKKR